MFATISRRTLVVLAAFSLAACGGGSTGPDDDGDTGPASLTLALGNQGRATVNAGGSTTIPVSIVRTNFDGLVTVNVRTLPEGVTVEPLTFTPSQTTGTLIINAGSGAPATRPAQSVSISASAVGITSGTFFMTLTVNRP